YGALPVAYASGGIQEIVEDYDPTLEPSESGYGFLCYDYSAEAFWDSIKRARALFRDRTVWTDLIRRAMAREFSWSAAAQRYEELYRGLVGDPELAALVGAVHRTVRSFDSGERRLLACCCRRPAGNIPMRSRIAGVLRGAHASRVLVSASRRNSLAREQEAWEQSLR